VGGVVLYLGLVLPAAPAGGEALSDAELLAQAEARFREGVSRRDQPEAARQLFRTAAADYEELRRRGVHNADLYRNQGNAYLLADDLARAILAYRRGLRLDPSDCDLYRNLVHAREQVVYLPRSNLGRPPEGAWPPWLTYWTIRLGLGLVVVLNGLGWLGVIRGLTTQRRRPLWLGCAALVIALLVAVVPVGLWVVEKRRDQQDQQQPLVVIAGDGVLLRTGNGPAYPVVDDAPLNRGVEARRLFDRGEWLQIRLAGGEVGWVPSALVLVDAH
jgi:hypothetical protein